MCACGTFPLLTQADHLSLVAGQLQLFVEHCYHWNRLQRGARRAVKKSVRLPAQRKGMGSLKAVDEVGVRASEFGPLSCRLVTGGTECVVGRLLCWLACNGGDVAGNDVDDDGR